MKTRKNLRPNVAAPVARTNASTSSKGAAVEASWAPLPLGLPPGMARPEGLPPFAGDDAE